MPLRLNEVILVAITAIALTACASIKKSPEDKAQAAFDEVRMSVQTIVSDADRAAQATALIDEMERNFRNNAAEVDERRAAFNRLWSNYDTPEAELEVALAKVRESMRINREEYSDTRHRLAEILTVEEWKALQKQRNKALKRAVSATLL